MKKQVSLPQYWMHSMEAFKRLREGTVRREIIRIGVSRWWDVKDGFEIGVWDILPEAGLHQITKEQLGYMGRVRSRMGFP